MCDQLQNVQSKHKILTGNNLSSKTLQLKSQERQIQIIVVIRIEEALPHQQ